MKTLVYFIHEAVRGLFKAKLMTSVSIITIAVALFFMSVIGLAIANIGVYLARSADQADMAVYVSDSLSANAISLSSLALQLNKMPQIKQVIVVDKAAAREKFIALYGREMLDAVDENPLPASLDIILKEQYNLSENADSLRQVIEKIRGVETVRFAGTWMDNLAKYRDIFYAVVAVFFIIIIITLHIVISNTIKLTIYARKDLIHIMYMVGATRFFISVPFILEGMLQGTVGAIIGIIAYFLLRAASSELLFFSWPAILPAFILFLGVLFGWLGSVFALRKFLV